MAEKNEFPNWIDKFERKVSLQFGSFWNKRPTFEIAFRWNNKEEKNKL